PVSCRPGVGQARPLRFLSLVRGTLGARFGSPRRGSPARGSPRRRGGAGARRRRARSAGRSSHHPGASRSSGRRPGGGLRAVQPTVVGLPRYESDGRRALRPRGQLTGPGPAAEDAGGGGAVRGTAGRAHHTGDARRPSPLRGRAARAARRPGRGPYRRRQRTLVRVGGDQGRPPEGGSLVASATCGRTAGGRTAMNYEILDALSQITREKSVDRQMLVETLEAGLASAVRKKHGATADVLVSFSNDTGAITVALRKTVVE